MIGNENGKEEFLKEMDLIIRNREEVDKREKFRKERVKNEEKKKFQE